MPVLIGPGVGSPVGCRLSHPNAVAPRRRYARHIAFGASGGRFLIRNSIGSIFTRSASSSISTSVMKRALRVARRTHRALLTRIDEDVLVRAPPVRELVDVGQRESGRGAGAARAPRLGVERRQHPVGRHASFDARGRRRPIARGEMLFLPIEHQLDRGLRFLGQPRADDGPAASGPILLPKPPPM